MIEALVNPDTGDVIVVKPVGSVWGRCEVNAVVKLDDPELEKELAGKEHIVYPYAAYEEKTETIGDEKQEIVRREMLEVSVVKVKVDDAAAMKEVSSKEGVLTLADAKQAATEAEVTEVVEPTAKDGGEVKTPERELPQATKDGGTVDEPVER